MKTFQTHSIYLKEFKPHLNTIKDLFENPYKYLKSNSFVYNSKFGATTYTTIAREIIKCNFVTIQFEVLTNFSSTSIFDPKRKIPSTARTVRISGGLNMKTKIEVCPPFKKIYIYA